MKKKMNWSVLGLIVLALCTVLNFIIQMQIGREETVIPPKEVHEIVIEAPKVETVEVTIINAVRIDARETYISEEYQRYCFEIAEKYDICPELLISMIERESNGRKDVSNSAGDSGLLQVNPKWHRDRMERLGVTDLYDPYSNILVAADYLAELLEQNGDMYLALMKYNMVHDTAERMYKNGKYSEYAIAVSERAKELQELHEEEGELYEKTDID